MEYSWWYQRIFVVTRVDFLSFRSTITEQLRTSPNLKLFSHIFTRTHSRKRKYYSRASLEKLLHMEWYKVSRNTSTPATYSHVMLYLLSFLRWSKIWLERNKWSELWLAIDLLGAVYVENIFCMSENLKILLSWDFKCKKKKLKLKFPLMHDLAILYFRI